MGVRVQRGGLLNVSCSIFVYLMDTHSSMYTTSAAKQLRATTTKKPKRIVHTACDKSSRKLVQIHKSKVRVLSFLHILYVCWELRVIVGLVVRMAVRLDLIENVTIVLGITNRKKYTNRWIESIR